MSDQTSTQLSLPYIQPAQAQKHVTHNEALRALDILVQLAVISRNLTSPPATPQDGDRHIVAPAATQGWAGQDRALAVFEQGGWSFLTPREGWRAWVSSEGRIVVFTAGGWATAGSDPTSFALLGVNAQANASNRLSVSSPATLLTHEGSDHRLKVNKADSAATASLLFQSGYSGRAEMGVAGNDDFSVKVSPDGTVWAEALRVHRATGSVTAGKGIDSAQIVVQFNTVGSVPAPTSGGFLMISVVDPVNPLVSACAIMSYDVGPTPQLLNVFLGTQMANLGSVLPTGTSSPAGKVGLSAVSDGRIYIENRHTSAGPLQFSLTFINGWRAID